GVVGEKEIGRGPNSLGLQPVHELGRARGEQVYLDSGLCLEDVEHRFDQALRAARVDDQSVSRLAVGRRDQDGADDSQHGQMANPFLRAAASGRRSMSQFSNSTIFPQAVQIRWSWCPL